MSSSQRYTVARWKCSSASATLVASSFAGIPLISFFAANSRNGYACRSSNLPFCETKAKRSKGWPRSSNGRLNPARNTSTRWNRLRPFKKTARPSSPTASPEISLPVLSSLSSSSDSKATRSWRWKSAHERKFRIELGRRALVTKG
jgi:hypothetical protein